MESSKRIGLLAGIVCAAIPLLCDGVEAGGGPAKGKPPAPAPQAPAVALPAGCTWLAEGRMPSISPDGKRLAFARFLRLPVRPGQKPMRQDIVAERGAHTWIRDLIGKKKAEVQLADDVAPVGWTTDGTLLLDAGYGIETAKGAKAPKVAAVSPDTKVWEVAWTRDGKRLAYVPRAGTEPEKSADKGKGPAPVSTLKWVEVGGSPATVPGTEGLRTDQAAFISWSPDGTTLVVNALFQGEGSFPKRRVLLSNLTAGTSKTLDEMPDWVDLPGLHNDFPRFRDPRIESPKDVDLRYRRPHGARHGSDLWDGKGRRVVWLSGTGWTEADAFVADVASGTVTRVTNDGIAKWSPALDESGRRLAFLTAQDTEPITGTYSPRTLRVLDLVTGEPSDFVVPADSGIPGSLAWAPDGLHLVYEIQGGEAEGVYLQTVAAPKPLPPVAAGAPEAPIRTVPYDASNRIIAWLASYEADRVHTALHRAEDAWSPVYVPALRETLAGWKDKDDGPIHCLTKLLADRQVSEALPEIRAVVASKVDSNRLAAIPALVKLAGAEAIPDLEKARTTSKDVDVKITAGAAMVGLGDPRGWEDLEGAAKSKDLDPRLLLCRLLWKIRDPKSVDLLIPMVVDKTDLKYQGVGDWRTLGAAAQLVLQILTGRQFGADAGVWKTWWNGDGKRTLPASAPIPAGAEKLLRD